ncbi:hypothetical protein SAMN04487770_1011 [Butyrivibrio sp. ob235]|nr:hypothetical protein SAMN04487770_1011 [Butyrivibrio sp. ob235]
MTTKGNEFESTTIRAAVHGAAIGRISAIEHLIDVFNFSFAGVKSILNFFVMIAEQIL